MRPSGSRRFGLAEQPLEVADIAVDRHAEIGLAIVAARDLVEGRLAVEGVDVPAEHAALAGPEALPHVGRGAVVDGAGNLVEPELSAALRRRRLPEAPRRSPVAPA